MAVAKMKLVNIVGRLRDFDDIVRQCCIKGNFQPEQSMTALEGYQEFKPIEETNPYMRHLRMAVDIGVHSDLSLSYRGFDQLRLSDAELEHAVEQIEIEIGKLNEAVRGIKSREAHLDGGIRQLIHLESLGINLDDLNGCRYLSFRSGRLPKSSFEKLELNEDDLMLFVPVGEDDAYFWGFYACLKQDAAKIDEIFNSLYFERIDIIEEAHGTPKEAIENLNGLLEKTRNELTAAQKAVKDYWEEHLDSFLRYYSRLRYLHDSFDLRRYAAKCGESFYVFGWVPENEVADFTAQFDKMKYVDCIVEDEKEAGSIEPPTKLVNPSAIRPYEGFVAMYGLPNYREIDPTPLMAITYSLFFGLMFGDLGQGLVLFLGAAVSWLRKKSFLAGVIMRCSIFSMIFGTLYNSFFGYDDILPIPTVLPVHKSTSANYILLVSVAIGIVIILMCMLINVINGIRQRNPDKVLFSGNGVAGLALYITLVSGVVFLMMFNRNILTLPVVLGLVILPLLLIFLHEPLTRLMRRRRDWMPENKLEYVIESFFDLFDVLLGYLSNTISFVRIGAYTLSHTGMMLAVFTIAELSGKGQNPVAIVIGNIFVMVLEALMAGIQDMRLQYYEMFSRFYQGDGREYHPFTIKYNP